jgi:phenylpropionate dioxygenase-like ring-hydroxylating dioxygenase large terminal subunit
MGTTHDGSWAAALTDPEAFRREQERLGSYWTLVGLTHDVPEDGCWVRARLGGRSIFVQRFGEDIRAFENLCPHRFMPLRTRDRGSGTVRCGFHHWHFNVEGEATGIPKCSDMYGCKPRELGQRLRPVEVAVCGSLIFGRFAGQRPSQSLEDFLGEALPVLRAMTLTQARPRRIDSQVACNWRLCVHVSMDDYHLVAVHPDTFGRGGYLPSDAVRYYRLGLHSAYFYKGGDGSLTEMVVTCRNGTYAPTRYRIFNIFPNLLVSHVPNAGHWHVLVQQAVPRAPDATDIRTWYVPSPFPARERGARRVMRTLLAPWMPWIMYFGIRKIVREDNRVCEAIQTTASQIGSFPVLARHEERIGWFEETYRQAVGDLSRPE